MGLYGEKIYSHGKAEILPRCERVCWFCASNSIEDEEHFLLECLLYNNCRGEFLSIIFKTCPNLILLKNAHLFLWMMLNEDPAFNILLCQHQYLVQIFYARNQMT